MHNNSAVTASHMETGYLNLRLLYTHKAQTFLLLCRISQQKTQKFRLQASLPNEVQIKGEHYLLPAQGNTCEKMYKQPCIPQSLPAHCLLFSLANKFCVFTWWDRLLPGLCAIPASIGICSFLGLQLSSRQNSIEFYLAQ